MAEARRRRFAAPRWPVYLLTAANKPLPAADRPPHNHPLERTAAAVNFTCGRTSRVRRRSRSTALRYAAESRPTNSSAAVPVGLRGPTTWRIAAAMGVGISACWCVRLGLHSGRLHIRASPVGRCSVEHHLVLRVYHLRCQRGDVPVDWAGGCWRERRNKPRYSHVGVCCDRPCWRLPASLCDRRCPARELDERHLIAAVRRLHNPPL